MDEERIVIGRPRAALTKEQKVGLSFIITCGLGSLVLGGLYVWRHIAVPFVIEYEGPRLLVGDDKQSAEVLKEKSADTDGDTISDYEERNVYGTNPYLSDSDSDGASDSAEITSGQDPNCATGDACNDSILEDSGAIRNETVSLGNLTPPTPPAGLEANAGSETALDAESLQKLQDLSVKDIRTLLISSGAKAEEVNALSDAEINELYQEILASLTVANP